VLAGKGVVEIEERRKERGAVVSDCVLKFVAKAIVCDCALLRIALLQETKR